MDRRITALCDDGLKALPLWLFRWGRRSSSASNQASIRWPSTEVVPHRRYDWPKQYARQSRREPHDAPGATTSFEVTDILPGLTRFANLYIVTIVAGGFIF